MAKGATKDDTQMNSAKLATAKKTTESVNLTDIAEGTYTGSYDVANLLDGTLVYKKSTQLKDFADDLLATEPTQLGEGVEWYDLKYGIDSDSRLYKGLLTRKNSRGVVEAVIKKATKYATIDDSPSMSFIIGSPGIGKTRTLTFALRQLLLQNDDVNVQYFNQKNAEAYLFLRRRGITYAFKAKMVPEKANGCLFSFELKKDLLTFILLDPSEEGARFVHPQSAHLIVSCSANIKHYLNISKEASALQYYLGLPSIKEVEMMSKKLNPDLDRGELLKRISDVGPVPRYIFRKDKSFEQRKKNIELKGARNNTDIDEALVLTALTNGTAVSESPTLCGALFAHVNIETTDDKGVRSTNYEEQRVSVLSQYAAWLLYKRFRSAFVKAIMDIGDCDTTAMFEKLCAFDLIVGGTFKVAKMGANRLTVRHFAAASSVIRVMPSRSGEETRKVIVKPALSGESRIATDYKVSEAFEPPSKKRKVGPPFIVLPDGLSAIDFLNTDRQVFQATMGGDHDMKGWVNLLLDANILSSGNKFKLEINKKTEPLEFYWVVPRHKVSWEKRKPKTLTKSDIPEKYRNQKALIDEAVEKHVRQFVLFIEQEQPRQSEFWYDWRPLRKLFKR